MKLLILTQKVDISDDNLGSFHAWIEEFAKNCESVIVICLQKGEYSLPANVKVFSLGKEEGVSKLTYFFRFYKYIFGEWKNYDKVFVHMNPEYVVLGWKTWWLLRKKIFLWYTHKQVDLKLRFAEIFVSKIFTASEKSFRLPSKKVIVTGHGIDTNKFVPNNTLISKMRIISAGRISQTKNLNILIDVAEILKNKNFDFEINIAGTSILEKDKIYFEKLKQIINERKLKDKINFVGKIPYKDIVSFYQDADLFVNFSDTGSVDRSVLEAMSCGLHVLTANEAFKDILNEKYLTSKNPEEIAEKIIALSKLEKDLSLRECVIKNHNLSNLIKKIVNKIYE